MLTLCQLVTHMLSTVNPNLHQPYVESFGSVQPHSHKPPSSDESLQPTCTAVFSADGLQAVRLNKACTQVRESEWRVCMCPTQPATCRPMAAVKILTDGTRREESQPVTRLRIIQGPPGSAPWPRSRHCLPTIAPNCSRSRAAPEPLDGREDAHICTDAACHAQNTHRPLTVASSINIDTRLSGQKIYHRTRCAASRANAGDSSARVGLPSFLHHTI